MTNLYTNLDHYRITPCKTRIFIPCTIYVNEGVHIIKGFIYQNIFTYIFYIFNIVLLLVFVSGG